MKANLYLVLVLSGVLSSCDSRHAPTPPSVEQMLDWAGFPGDFRLTSASHTNQVDSAWGKPIWHHSYGNPSSSLVGFNVMIFPAGTLWGTNHAKMAQNVEDAATKMRSIEGIRDRDRSAILKAIQVLSLPDGHKAYFFVMGVGPGGQVGGAFSYEQSYDLLVTEGFDAEDDMPIAKKITNPVNPTNDLPTVFLKIRASLAAQ